jgi:hypothetical protein
MPLEIFILYSYRVKFAPYFPSFLTLLIITLTKTVKGRKIIFCGYISGEISKNFFSFPLDLSLSYGSGVIEVQQKTKGEKKMNIEKMVEHLQETGKVYFPKGDVREAIEELDRIGYEVYFEPSTDNLILNKEKKWRMYTIQFSQEELNTIKHALEIAKIDVGHLPKEIRKSELEQIEKLLKELKELPF